MILPDKNLLLSHSLLGMGSVVLDELTIPQTISSLWEKAHREGVTPFEKFILTLDLLYTFGLIEFDGSIIQRRRT